MSKKQKVSGDFHMRFFDPATFALDGGEYWFPSRKASRREMERPWQIRWPNGTTIRGCPHSFVFWLIGFGAILPDAPLEPDTSSDLQLFSFFAKKTV